MYQGETQSFLIAKKERAGFHPYIGALFADHEKTAFLGNSIPFGTAPDQFRPGLAPASPRLKRRQPGTSASIGDPPYRAFGSWWRGRQDEFPSRRCGSGRVRPRKAAECVKSEEWAKINALERSRKVHSGPIRPLVPWTGPSSSSPRGLFIPKPELHPPLAAMSLSHSARSSAAKLRCAKRIMRLATFSTFHVIAIPFKSRQTSMER